MTPEKAKLKDLLKFQAAYEKLLKKHPKVMIVPTITGKLVAYDVTLNCPNQVQLSSTAPL